MKISIVMGYHNRRALLINTLKSIAYYNEGKNDFETIIIDDGSDPVQRIEDLPGMFPGLHIFVMYLNPKVKKHLNPCITHNIGFNFVTGDVVLHQNTECLHVGDILGVVRQQTDYGNHLTFACYSVNQRLQNNINKITEFKFENIKKAIMPMVGYKERWTDGDICWYNHSRYRRAFGSFCWAMTTHDLELMNGFDERYAFGFAYDDAEFTIRLCRKRVFIRYTDFPFVVHQYHVPSNYQKMAVQAEINRKLYHNFTMKEKGYKALYNVYYKKT
jgi:glycosyltransferase involved in cell wall biosynthesis